jgi:hypothetical protein
MFFGFGIQSVVVCSYNFVFMSNFLVFAFQRGEFTLWVDLGFSPVRGSKARYFLLFLEINESAGY